MQNIGIAIIGCGGVTLQNHLPGLALCPEARVVALCDNDPATLQRAARQTGIAIASTRYEEIVKRDDVQAVIIATPNFTHAPIALDAIAHGVTGVSAITEAVARIAGVVAQQWPF